LRCWVSLFSVLLVALLMLSVPWALAVSPEEASAAVANAEGSLHDAFRMVADAEAMGANVSALMERLNHAGDALTGAEVALADADYSEATSKAEVCKGLADGVSGDAGILKSDAVAKASGWLVTVSFSVVGAAAFLTVLFLVWRRLRRGYEEKVFGSRPEVVS
jgi:hypothetical protein